MNHYKFLGFHLESDLEYPYMISDEEDQTAEICFVAGEIPNHILEMEKENIYYEYGKEESFLTNPIVRMYIQNGKKITYELKQDHAEDVEVVNSLRAFLIGFGMSTLALQRDQLAIHCSVITDAQYAYLICGESGSGKSTLTKQFLDAGYRFMVDDMTIVDPISDEKYAYAKPAFPYQKLCRDAAINAGLDLEKLLYISEQKDKFLAPCGVEFVEKNMPIGGMIYLYPTKEEEVVFNVAEGLDKFYLCSNNLFLRHVLREDKYMPEIGSKCLKMASKIRICTIGRPAEKNTVDQIYQLASDFIGK